MRHEVQASLDKVGHSYIRLFLFPFFLPLFGERFYFSNIFVFHREVYIEGGFWDAFGLFFLLILNVLKF